MDLHSIKGSAIEAALADVRRLVEEGRVSAEEIEDRLAPQDLRLLKENAQPAKWYSIDFYARLVSLLRDVEGGGSRDYVVERGARAAERLFKLGVYPQLQRGDAVGARLRRKGARFGERDGKVLVSLSGALLSFMTWQVEVDEGDERVHRIIFSEAAALPDVVRDAVEGFVKYTTERVSGVPCVVTSERPTPDRIVYTLRIGGSL